MNSIMWKLREWRDFLLYKENEVKCQKVQTNGLKIMVEDEGITNSKNKTIKTRFS